MSFKETLKGLAGEILADASDLIDSAYQAIPGITDEVTTQTMQFINEGEDVAQRALVKAQSYVLDFQEKVEKL